MQQMSQVEIEKKALLILEKMKTEKKSLKEVLGFNEDFLENLYSLAYGYYNQGRYKESTSLFHLLAGASPTTFKYLFGLASSYYQVKDYENAAHGFFFSIFQAPENPYPSYYLADCFIQMGEIEGAVDFLDAAVEIAEGKPQYASFAARCLLMKKSLSECKK